MQAQIDNRRLQDVLRLMAAAGNAHSVCVRDLVECIGARSFGPLLLVPSLIVVSPLSGIPGVPSISALAIGLIAGQMLLGRAQLWLPEPLRARCVNRRRLDRAVGLLCPLASFVDRFVRPRLTALTHGLGRRLIAAVCVAIAVVMPPLELLPLASTTPAAVVSMFALALVAHDGLLALLGFVATAVLTGFGLVAVLALM